MIKAIAIDVDGTSINNDNEMSKELAGKLKELTNKGYHIIFVTGRSLSGTYKFIEQIEVHNKPVYALCYNGGAGYKFINKRKEVLFEEKMEKEEVENLFPILDRYYSTIATYTEEKISTTVRNKYVERGSELMNLKIDDQLFHRTPKVLIYDKPERITKYYAPLKKEILEYDPSLNVFSSAEHIIEITPENANKGRGLERMEDLASSNEIICFGDNLNDVPMFEYCKYSVAVENAHAEIKKIAKFTTESNIDDGVFKFLEKTNLEELD